MKALCELNISVVLDGGAVTEAIALKADAYGAATVHALTSFPLKLQISVTNSKIIPTITSGGANFTISVTAVCLRFQRLQKSYIGPVDEVQLNVVLNEVVSSFMVPFINKLLAPGVVIPVVDGVVLVNPSFVINDVAIPPLEVTLHRAMLRSALTWSINRLACCEVKVVGPFCQIALFERSRPCSLIPCCLLLLASYGGSISTTLKPALRIPRCDKKLLCTSSFCG